MVRAFTKRREGPSSEPLIIITDTEPPSSPRITNISCYGTNDIINKATNGGNSKERYSQTWSRSYQTFIFPVFRFSLLSLKVCSIWKKCVHCTTAKLSSKKWKNSSFAKKKSLVGLPHGRIRLAQQLTVRISLF